MNNVSMITIASPIGPLRLYGTCDVLTCVWLPEGRGTAPAEPVRETPVLARAAAQLTEYFAGTRTAFDLPLAPDGTEFQQGVWRVLATIPFGATWSYGDVARLIGQPTASRAVGAANGKNPIAIIVPCHRVIGASGALTGYGGGMDAKRWLLAHEGQQAQPQLTFGPASC
jgi:methylated-DNA-[protein]-cysteine S-methyltransferase